VDVRQVLCALLALFFLGQVQAALELTEKDVANSTGCAANSDCSSCVDARNCLWCESDSVCKEGNFYGIKGELFGGCDDWRWGQCKVNGKFLLLGTAGAVGGFLLLSVFGILICCCCCYKKRKGGYGYSKLDLGEELAEMEPHPQGRKQQQYPKWGSPQERRERQEAFESIYNNARSRPSFDL